MERDAKRQNLIYATGNFTSGCGGTCILSYPDGTVVGSIDILGTADCSDGAGNVFISTPDATIVEYAHGGTAPIKTLDVPGTLALGCSVDPTTGTLAVIFRGGNYVDVAVFTGAEGSPTSYWSQMTDSTFCGYDNVGNLFIDGTNQRYAALSELPAGSSATSKLTINGSVGFPGQMQWDGTHMTYESWRNGDVNVARLRISGSTATVIGKTHFRGLRGNASQSWIWGGVVVVPFGTQAKQPRIGVWHYPGGGKPQQKYTQFSGPPDFQGVTISVRS
jgi:hypothetical protein